MGTVIVVPLISLAEPAPSAVSRENLNFVAKLWGMRGEDQQRRFKQGFSSGPGQSCVPGVLHTAACGSLGLLPLQEPLPVSLGDPEWPR